MHISTKIAYKINDLPVTKELDPEKFSQLSAELNSLLDKLKSPAKTGGE